MPCATQKKSAQNSSETADGIAIPIASQILHLCQNDDTAAGDLFGQADQYTPPPFAWSNDKVISSFAAEDAKEIGASISSQFPRCPAIDVDTLLGSSHVLQPDLDADLLQAGRCYSYASLMPDPLPVSPIMLPSDGKFSTSDTSDSAFRQRLPNPDLVPAGVAWGPGAESQLEMSCGTASENEQQQLGLPGMDAGRRGVAWEGTGGDWSDRVFFDTNGTMAAAAASEAAFEESSGRFPKPVSASSAMDNYCYNVPPLSTKERNEKIQRYLQKRSQRNWSRSIKYACRKTIADTRARDHGRFARKHHGFDEARRSSFGSDTFEDGEFEELKAFFSHEDLGEEDVSEQRRRQCS